MAQEDNLHKLYINLTDDGYNLGTEDEFRKKLQNKATAEKFHQNMVDDGYQLGSFDEFVSMNGLSYQMPQSQLPADQVERRVQTARVPQPGERIEATHVDKDGNVLQTDTTQLVRGKVATVEIGTPQFTPPSSHEGEELARRNGYYNTKESLDDSFSYRPNEYGEMRYGWQRGQRIKQLNRTGLEFMNRTGAYDENYDQAASQAEKMSDAQLVAEFNKLSGQIADAEALAGTADGYAMATELRAYSHELRARDIGFAHGSENKKGIGQYQAAKQDPAVAAEILKQEAMSPEQRKAYLANAYKHIMAGEEGAPDIAMLAGTMIHAKESGIFPEEAYSQVVGIINNEHAEDVLAGALQSADAEIERLSQLIEQRTQQLYAEDEAEGMSLAKVMQHAESGSGAPIFNQRLLNDPELSMLWTAKRAAERRKKVIERKQDNHGFMRQFIGTFWDTATDINTWDFGIQDMRDAVNLVSFGNNKGSDAPMERAREAMLQNTVDAQEAEQRWRLSAAQRWGVIGGQALPFVAEFIGTGGGFSGVRQGVTKGVTSFLERSLGKAASNKAAQWLVRSTGMLTGDIASALLMANTTGSLKTYSNILDRKTGDLMQLYDGTFVYRNSTTMGDAILKGEVANTLEYYTEMLGNHLDGLISGVGKRLGLSRLSEGMKWLTGRQIQQLTTNVLRQGGINELPSEILEEEANLILNAMLAIDNNFDTGPLKELANKFGCNFEVDPNSEDYQRSIFNPETQADIWGGMLFSIGAMRAPSVAIGTVGQGIDAAKYGWNAANYYYYKHKTDLAGTKLNGLVGGDELLDRINNTTNEQIPSLVAGILADDDFTPDMKSLAMDYIGNLVKERGYNVRMFDNAKDLDPEQDQEEGETVDLSYQDGYNAADEEQAGVKERLDVARQSLYQLGYTDDDINALNGLETLDGLDEAALEYVNAQAAYEGMLQHVQDDMEGAIAESEAAVDAQTHIETGAVHHAVLKTGGEVWVVGGNVALTPEGNIDIENSDGDLIVLDPATGGKRMIHVSDLASADEPVMADQLKEEAAATIQESAISDASNRIDGVLPFQPGDVYTLPFDDGQEHTITVIGDAGDGVNIVASVDGGEQQLIPMQMIQGAADQQREARIVEQAAMEAAAGAATQETAEPVEEEQPAEEVTEEPAEEEQPDEDAMPMNGDEVDWFATSPERGHRFLYDEAGLSPEEADAVVANSVKDAEKELEKVSKKAPKPGNAAQLNKYRAEKEAHEQQVAAAQAAVDYWKGVQATQEAIRQQAEAELLAQRAEEGKQRSEAAAQTEAEKEAQRIADREAARQEREALNGVPDVVNDKPEDARARGFRNVNGERVDRQLLTNSVGGRTGSVKFSTDVTVPSRIAVIEADELQPSHIEGQRNPLFFLDEAQPKNRTDQASDVAAEKIAKNINPEEITGDGGAYQFSAPTVNERGEVVQGNNRSSALKRMWSSGAYADSQQRYKQYLIDHAEEFGLNPQLVASMNRPVMVNEISVDDAEAIRLGQMSAKDLESGGIERIDPVTTARKLGPKMRNFASVLLSGEDENMSLAELIAANGEAAVKWLADRGVISPTQVQSAWNPAKTGLTAEAKLDLQNILRQQLFQGGVSDLPHMFEAMPAKAQKAILSTFMRDMDSADADRILPELQHAIEAWYGAASGTSDFSKATNYEAASRAMLGWTNVRNAFSGVLPSEKFSKFAIELANCLQGSSMRNMVTYFNEFYDLVQGTGVGDLFGSGVSGEKLTLAEAIAKIFNVDINETNNGQERSEDVGSDRGDGQEGRQGEPGDAAGTEPAAPGAGAPERGGRAESNDQSVAQAEAEVDTEPTDGQKEAGNYKKGHVKIDGFDVTIEQPKGSVRSGVDASGKAWSQEMHNTYGYIRGTEGVDGDHIDVFLSDHLDNWNGMVYVVDQVNKDGSFDEHKVMYGFDSEQEARDAYLSNYEEGWTGLGNITGVTRDEFKKWVDSSHRKTKPFAEYKSVKVSRPIQGLEGYTEDEILADVRAFIEQQLEDAGIEGVSIKGMALHGSRMRGDARPDSDLDVVVEYEGDISEDSFFNLVNYDLNFRGPNGIIVDINPITRGKSGTLEQYMERSRRYDEEKLNGGGADVNETRPQQSGGTGNLTVAEVKDRIKFSDKEEERLFDEVADALTHDGLPISEAPVEVMLNSQEEIEERIRERVGDYIAEHYPTQATVSALTNSPDGLREREAMKKDADLAALRDEVEAEVASFNERFSQKLAELRAVLGKPDVTADEVASCWKDAVEFEHLRSENQENRSETEPKREKVTGKRSETEKKRSSAPKSGDRRIDDFGEKIGGARKDLARGRIRDAKKMSVKDLTTLKKGADDILSQANILRLYKDGQMDESTARHFMALNNVCKLAIKNKRPVIRDIVLGKYRDAAVAWEEGKPVTFDVTDKDLQAYRQMFPHSSEEKARESLVWQITDPLNMFMWTYESMNYPAEVRKMGQYVIVDYSKMLSPHVTLSRHIWVKNGYNAHRGYPFAKMEDAVEKMKKLCPVVQEKEKKSRGEKAEHGLRVVNEGYGYYVKSRNIPGNIYLSGKFNSEKQAQAYLDENLDRLREREQRLVDALMGSNIGMAEREGVDYRDGKDVTPQDFLDEFGFRGVEFGNWVPQGERQMYLNKTYDAIKDFCAIVGISPKAFSLGGRLGLAFGARGHSKAMAHYEPAKEVINLTRMSGVGSLAHEWFHAVDNYLAKQKTGNMSDMATVTHDVVRDELSHVFKELYDVMKSMDYHHRSRRAGEYWGRTEEEFARLFENYIYNKLASREATSPVLVRKDVLLEEVEEDMKARWPYPSLEENEKMEPYFDKLFDTIREKTDDNGHVVLFQKVEGSTISKDAAEREAALRDGLVELLRGAGIEVVTDTEEGQRVLDAVNGRVQMQRSQGESDLSGISDADLDKEYLTALDVVEKPSRIEKLRNSAPVNITKADYDGKYALNASDAQSWIKDNLRGEHTIKDTGEKILISKVGAEEVTSHSRYDDAHLKSISSIPRMLEDAIFIEEQASTKPSSKFDSFRYYVVGLTIDGVDYTAKIVIGVKQGKKYYDHRLTQMKKTKLIDFVNQPASGFTTAGNASLPPYTGSKDSKLVSLLQTKAEEIAEAEAKMRDILDEMKRRRGYSDDSSYQGTSAFNGAAPARNAYFPTREERVSAFDNGEMDGDANLGDFMDAGLDLWDLGWQINDPRSYRGADEERREAIRNLREVVNGKKKTVTMYRSIPSSVKEESFRNGDWITPSRRYAEENAEIHGWGDEYRIIEQEVPVDDVWWDGNDIAEWGYDNSQGEVYKNTANNRKSDDLVTRDDEGNVILPSQRYDERKGDIRYFRTADGTAYGFVKDGKIYIDPEIATSETPVHEYTHLWCAAMRRANPAAWARLKEALLGQKDVVDHVKKLYPELEGDELMDEVFAHYSGRRGRERLQREQEREVAKAKGIFDKARVVAVFDRIRRALDNFWLAARHLFAGKTEGLEKLSAEDFADMAMADLLRGFNPTEEVRKLDADGRKAAQLRLVTDANAMTDTYHTGIRRIDDIKTYEEAVAEGEGIGSYPDFTEEDARAALDRGRATVYSSHPIEPGSFVSMSRMEAEEYAGGGEVYSQEVPLEDVAWIYANEGQYAPVGDGGGAAAHGTRTQRTAPTFYSNAERAVEGVKQGKAKAEQWKAMLTKAGGIKSGEDKWMGLSQWLDEHKGETLTKDDVLQFVRDNGIKMEEIRYQEGLSVAQRQKLQELQDEFDEIISGYEALYDKTDEEYNDFMIEMEEKYGDGWEYEMSPGERATEDRLLEDRRKYGSQGEIWGMAWDEMVERYGDDFQQGFYNDGTGDLEVSRDASGNIDGAALYFLGDEESHPIDSTRLDYTTKGLENKREIAFVVPSVEPYQEHDEIHFGPENEGKAVMWVRFGATTDTDGKRVLVIDEIQSNRHQEGKKRGYRTEEAVREDLRLQKAVDRAQDRYDAFTRQMGDKYNGVYDDIYADMTDAERERADSLEQAVYAASQAYEQQNYNDVPVAPFEKNWHEVAMKRMLRLAAEEGFDKVAWTTGEQQAERYDIGDAIERIEKLDDRTYLVYPADGSAYMELEFDEDGVYRDDDDPQLNGKTMADIFGKETAERMMDLTDGDQLTGDGLRMGGEGMKGFYDQMLPRFMDKYGKRWGVKVGEVTLDTPGKETMHSVDVNEDMKRSVIENGQPLFQKKDVRVNNAQYSDYTDERLRDVLSEGGSLAIMENKGKWRIEGMPGEFNTRYSAIDEWRERAAGNVVWYFSEDGNSIIVEGEGDLYETMSRTSTTSDRRYRERLARQQEARVKRGRQMVDELAKKLGITVRYVDDMSAEERAALGARKLNSKGWYSPRTGEVYINLGRHTRLYDMEATFLHEVVAHKGLRRLFGKDFDTFIDNIYNNVNKGIRAEIDRMAEQQKSRATDNQRARHDDGHWRRVATEEYMARLAERLNLNHPEERTIWEKIREYVIDKLRKIGVHLAESLSDNDLRGLLWESYHSMEMEGVVGVAKGKVFRYQMEREANNGRTAPVHETAIAAEPAAQYTGTLFDMITPQAGAWQRMMSNMSERELFKEISQDGPNVTSSYTDEYDRRHIKDYNRACDEIQARLERELPYADRLLELLQDAVAQWEDGAYKDERRSGVLAAIDTISRALDEEGAELPSVEDESLYRDDEDDTDDVDVDGFDAGRTFDDDVLTNMMKAAADSKASLLARVHAMHELGGNLSELRQAMSLQREYDRGTVNRVVQLAKDMMDSGLFKDFSRTEVKRLVGLINNAAGNEDITWQLEKVFDMLQDHEIKEWDNLFKQMLNTRDVKINNQGVRVQGQLDTEGQRMIRALRDSYKLNDEQFSQRMSDCMDRMGSDSDIVAHNARIEYEGLLFAQKYRDIIGKLRDDNADIKHQRRVLEEQIYDFYRVPVTDKDGNPVKNKTTGKVRTSERKRLKPEFGGKDENGNRVHATEEAKRQRKAIEGAISELNNKCRQNKVDMAKAYEELTNNLGVGLAISITRAKEWVDAEKARINEIHHAANSDLLGVDRTTQGVDKSEEGGVANNKVLRFWLAPMASFEKLMRFFGRRSINGEGRLFNMFVRRHQDCVHEHWNSFKAGLDELDGKAKELFGYKWMHLGDKMRDGKKFPPIEVSYWDNGEYVTDELRQDEAAYIYCLNKMGDGRMKLLAMGIDDDMVEAIRQKIDPRLIKLADWYQGEFLPNHREHYNAVYERMFGAPMANIENYIHIVINPKSITQNKEINEREQESETPSTITGSLKERKTNVTPIRLHTSLIGMAMQEHEKMEKWAAWAEFSRDLKDLLNFKSFQAKVTNLSSKEFGSGKDLWNTFERTCAIVTGDFVPAGNKSGIDRFAANWAKFVATAKISFRAFTALKQLLSFPAFMSDARPGDLIFSMGNPKGSIEWAMENLPGFARRWQSRQAGDTRLMETNRDSAIWKKKVVKKIGRAGLLANASVDCLTVAIGARGVYMTAKSRYLSYGYDEVTAERKALQDASISYNSSQQSNEGAYVSSQQVERTVMSIATTCFRNASMGYGRRLTTGLRNLKNMAKKGYKEEVIANTIKQMMEEGLTEEQAKAAAERAYNRAIWHSMMDVANYGFILPFIWNLGPYLIYLIGSGDDDDEKKELWKDAALHSLFGPIEGFTFGGTTSEMLNHYVGAWLLGDKSFKEATADLRYRNLNPLPLLSDAQSLFNTFSTDAWSGCNDVINLLVQAGTGVNPETFTDMGVAIIDACNGDFSTAKEVAYLMMRLNNMPQSMIDKHYIDEIGLSAKDARQLSAGELARRYARYKAFKDAPLPATALHYLDNDAEQAREKRYLKRFDNLVKERLEGHGIQYLEDAYSRSDAYLQKLIGSAIEKRVGELGDVELRSAYDVTSNEATKEAAHTELMNRLRKVEGEKDPYGSPQTEYGKIYNNIKKSIDVEEDLLLIRAQNAAAADGDEDLAKDIAKERKDITTKYRSKLTGGSGDDEVMEDLRAARAELINTYVNKRR